ncbi:hypothetical protein CMI47_06760 [Candidatus Pacearchaeota archaeon]|nr:hypothetical protein [Candidatus Pacearchaeota archaeon]|tara:strand:+ start:201 stop:581 length:381 start_codon:yes stop_codon:yes gene_type:complete
MPTSKQIARAKKTGQKIAGKGREAAKQASKYAEKARKSEMVNFILPSNHQKSRSGAGVVTPIAVEKSLQRQRMVMMGVVGPMMMYPLFRSTQPLWYRISIALFGAAAMYANYQQYEDTRPAMKGKR